MKQPHILISSKEGKDYTKKKVSSTYWNSEGNIYRIQVEFYEDDKNVLFMNSTEEKNVFKSATHKYVGILINE